MSSLSSVSATNPVSSDSTSAAVADGATPNTARLSTRQPAGGDIDVYVSPRRDIAVARKFFSTGRIQPVEAPAIPGHAEPAVTPSSSSEYLQAPRPASRAATIASGLVVTCSLEKMFDT